MIEMLKYLLVNQQTILKIYGWAKLKPNIRINGERSMPAIPILSAGILDLIGERILSKYLSKKLLTWPMGWS